MKAGARAVGIAESYAGERSTLGGVVVRRDRAVESVAFGSITVGGSDATSGICALLDELARPDARYVFVAGVALAWFNVVDLAAVHEHADRPVLAVTFEASEGLESALREAFDGDDLDARLAAYRALPARRAVAVDGADDAVAVDGADDAGASEGREERDRRVFVRAVGVDDERAATIVRAFTHERVRPEPVRVAKEVARAGDAFRRDD